MRNTSRTIAILVIVALTQAASSAGDTITYKDLVSRLTDLERLATPIVAGEKTFASTSHDRGSRYNPETDRYENWNANRDGGGWWGEGDERFFIDGEKYPSTVGTGSEDYVGYAWAANPPFITFDSPQAAVSRLRPDAQEDASNCRFHVCDDLPFGDSFQGFIETLTFPNCRPVLYDTCVYWYRETGAENPYPMVPVEGRRHQRPGRDMPHVAPPTFQIPKPEPPQPAMIEGESMRVLKVGSGRTWIQNMGGFRDGQWSGGRQLIWTQGNKGDSVEMELNVADGGKQELIVVLTKANDYGIVQLTMDGKDIGKPIDCYDEKVTTTGEISLGAVDLSTGKHVLKATVIDCNEKARNAVVAGNHIFGLD